MLLFDFINPYVVFMTIVLAFSFCVYAMFTKHAWIERHKRTILIVVAVLLAWTQVARYIGVFFQQDQYWSIGFLNFRILAFEWESHLPFYICRLSVLVLLYYVITKDRKVESFLFYWGATGLAGIIYPNGPIDNIATLTETFYLDHFLLGLTPFFLVLYQGYEPVRRDLFIITGVMFVILAAFIPINLWANQILGLDGAVDYFYVSDQSIFGDIFPNQPSIVFVVVHTLVAFGYFSVLYRFFNSKQFDWTKQVAA